MESAGPQRASPVIGWRLWVALLGSIVAMGIFAHVGYGASVGQSLVGLLTTCLVLAVIAAIAQLGSPRSDGQSRRGSQVDAGPKPATHSRGATDQT